MDVEVYRGQRSIDDDGDCDEGERVDRVEWSKRNIRLVWNRICMGGGGWASANAAPTSADMIALFVFYANRKVLKMNPSGLVAIKDWWEKIMGEKMMKVQWCGMMMSIRATDRKKWTRHPPKSELIVFCFFIHGLFYPEDVLSKAKTKSHLSSQRWEAYVCV